MSLTKYEHETVVSMNDAETVAYVYTAQARVLNRLRRHPAARLVEEGEHEGSVWARFEVPAKLVAFRTPAPPLTEEQRAAAAARLRQGSAGTASSAGVGQPSADEPALAHSQVTPRLSGTAGAVSGPRGDGAR